jgi:catechol 2,3-dioxygenase-like lactoylglutathione lyase family enzyme
MDAIGMVVQDMARSLAFYRELGIDIPPNSDDQPHVEATLPSGLRLMWDPVATVTSFDSSWTPSSGGPPMALAFLMDSPAEVDRVYERLVSLGFEGHLAPWDAFWGQRYASVRDPDGNGVDLFAPSDAG